MLAKILIGVAAAVAAIVIVFVIVVAMQPNEFRITRSATMSAPASAVFAQVNDFHNWDAWSPWAKIDPSAKSSFEGTSSGTGAIFRWAGNAEIGEGSMTITESQPSDLIRIRLDFEKPFKDTSNVEFSFKPAGDHTAVTWSMDGKNNFLAKAFCLLMNMNMEKMIGSKYEEGLANIKAIVEAAPSSAEAPASDSPAQTEN
jgi:Polyketide cyclase / dehydrase and lipid transport